jgi:hypothetical protein
LIPRAGAVLARLRERLGGAITLRAVSVVIVPIVLSPLLAHEMARQLGSPLWRDTAQSHYSGWCIAHGYKLYRDVGAPDGPFIHFLHAGIHLLGGRTDHGCRVVDLFIQLIGSGLAGALLAPRFAATRTASVLQRLAWAALGSTLWMSWYLHQGWTQTVQRDPYFALFGYLGLVFIFASADFAPRAARVTAAIGGALCASMLFSRHTGIIYPACAALGLLLADDPEREQRRMRIKAALVGAVAAIVLMFVAMLLFASVTGFFFWYFRFAFTFHRWLLKQNAWDLFIDRYDWVIPISAITIVSVVAAIALRLFPRRGLQFAFPPMLFLIAACLAGKGWPNHVQQVTAMTVFLPLLALSQIWNTGADRPRWHRAQSLLAVAALMFVSEQLVDTLRRGEYFRMPKPQPVDADIAEAKAVGEYLHEHTRTGQPVLLYGHESHVLIDAQRPPATPYYVNMSFNIARFYEQQPADEKEAPNKDQLAALARLQADIKADACARIDSKPPAAMAFLKTSMGIFGNGVEEVIQLCPHVRELLKNRYKEVPVPSAPSYQVFLKK